MTKKSKYELADVIKRFGRQLTDSQKLSPEQTKVLNNIVDCRTAIMGGHEQVCTCCGEVTYSYNSCGDRHCPKCQLTKQAIWVDDLVQSTLPVKHYHIIFTVPHVLNEVCLWNKKLYYKILFDSVWNTLRTFGYTHFGAETGAVAILHSWGQNLSLHPHIHCIVPAAGYTLNGKWKIIGKYKNYLYPVHQLSDMFKGKFLDSLKRKLKKINHSNNFKQQIQKAYSTKWVVYSESSMADEKHVMQYLGQYTHRIAITNKRIVKINDTEVTFFAKDYRDRGQKKPVVLEGTEFLRRFCQHVMPQRFVRIRRYGIYNHTTVKNLDLQFFTPAQETEKKIAKKLETPRERVVRLIGFNPYICKSCKKGELIIIKEIPRIRSPAGHLPTIFAEKLL